jgi:hypothetical protein
VANCHVFIALSIFSVACGTPEERNLRDSMITAMRSRSTARMQMRAFAVFRFQMSV